MAVCCCGWTHCVDLWQCKRDCSFRRLDNKKRCNWWLASTTGLLFLWLRKLWHGRCNTAFILQRIPLFAPHCPALPRTAPRLETATLASSLLKNGNFHSGLALPNILQLLLLPANRRECLKTLLSNVTRTLYNILSPPFAFLIWSSLQSHLLSLRFIYTAPIEWETSRLHRPLL